MSVRRRYRLAVPVAATAMLLIVAGGWRPAGAADGVFPPAKGLRPPVARPLPTVPSTRPMTTGAARSNCASCHVESSWSEAKFDHRRTGFPLTGAHDKVACQACHPRDYTTRVADTCAGCHRDRHAGELGLHCEGCHQTTTWRDTAFGTDGHRTTAFPLTGKHAAIPCQECHGDLRERSFSRAPLGCVDCHRKDVAAAALTSIDHTAARFGDACQSCHTTWAFFPARFRAHDSCFTVSNGSHRNLRCPQCHTSPTTLALTGLCASQDVRCVSCHSHSCEVSNRQHQNVMGYDCVDQKCFQCHRTEAR